MPGQNPEYRFDPRIGEEIEKLKRNRAYSADQIEELISTVRDLVEDIFLYRSLGGRGVSIQEQDQEFEAITSFARDFSVPTVRNLEGNGLVSYSVLAEKDFRFVVIWTNAYVPVVLDITIEDRFSGSIVMGIGF